uniref:Ig-like domain-containing protein n=1 Tax=Poecilia mexicana TaxID=48701 RepID=A0A3B3XJW0_9TELE
MHGLVALILLSTVCIIETAEVPRLISTTERKPGDNVTFSCQSSKDHRFLQWYKQSPGKMIQTMATGVYGKPTPTKTFNNTRFQFHRENNEISLTIHSVKKEDEAVYFCQSGTEFLLTVHNGFLLVVKGNVTAVVIFSENNYPSLNFQVQHFCALV